VLRFNAPVAARIYADIAVDAFPDLAVIDDEEERCAAFIDHLEALSARLGLKQRLHEVGVRPEDVAGLARDAMKQTRLLVNNPRDMNESEALAIYQAAF
jgi:alcohol dehydrogenase class IV